MPYSLDQILNGVHLVQPKSADQPTDLAKLSDGEIIKIWLDEYTEKGSSYPQVLHAAYQQFCALHGKEPVGVAKFGVALRLFGVEGRHDRRGTRVPITTKRISLPPGAPRRPPPPADQAPPPRRPSPRAALRRLGIR